MYCAVPGQSFLVLNATHMCSQQPVQVLYRVPMYYIACPCIVKCVHVLYIVNMYCISCKSMVRRVQLLCIMKKYCCVLYLGNENLRAGARGARPVRGESLPSMI